MAVMPSRAATRASTERASATAPISMNARAASAPAAAVIGVIGAQATPGTGGRSRTDRRSPLVLRARSLALEEVTKLPEPLRSSHRDHDVSHLDQVVRPRRRQRFLAPHDGDDRDPRTGSKLCIADGGTSMLRARP